MRPCTTFPRIIHVRQAKTRISLYTRAVRSVFPAHYKGKQGSKTSFCANAQADLRLRWAQMQCLESAVLCTGVLSYAVYIALLGATNSVVQNENNVTIRMRPEQKSSITP